MYEVATVCPTNPDQGLAAVLNVSEDSRFADFDGSIRTPYIVPRCDEHARSLRYDLGGAANQQVTSRTRRCPGS